MLLLRHSITFILRSPNIDLQVITTCPWVSYILLIHKDFVSLPVYVVTEDLCSCLILLLLMFITRSHCMNAL